MLTIGEQKMDKKGTYTNGEDAYDSSFEICVVDWTKKKLIAKTRHTVTAPQSIKFYDSLYLEDRKRLGRWITTWAQEETSPPPQKPEPVKEQ